MVAKKKYGNMRILICVAFFSLLSPVARHRVKDIWYTVIFEYRQFDILHLAHLLLLQ
jgi:hypothetical protein